MADPVRPSRPSDAVKVVQRQTISARQGVVPHTGQPAVRTANPVGVTMTEGVPNRGAVKVIQQQPTGQVQITARQNPPVQPQNAVTAIPQGQPVAQTPGLPPPPVAPQVVIPPQPAVAIPQTPATGVLPSAVANMAAMGMTQAETPPPGTFQVQTVPTPAYATARSVDLTVFITVHNRPERLAEQTRAILLQSVKPKLNVAWVTFQGQPVGDAQFFMPIFSPIDWGPWPKFGFAKHVSSKYVAIFEDDIVPGPQWLEAAVEFLERNDVLIGAVGVRINEDGTETVYDFENRTGEVTQVDYAKGGWICKREHLVFATADNGHVDRLFGWQVHLSTRLQAQGVPTIVLPYSDTTCGTSVPPIPGLSAHPKYLETKQRVMQSYLEEGWGLLVDVGREEEEPPTEAPIP